MLCQFIVKNFKSYRDETVFDMQAATIDEHGESLLQSAVNKNTFLPVSVLYGPNGGGKSGIIEAFNYLLLYIVRPIHLMGHEALSIKRADFPSISYAPFAFNETSSNEPTEFTVYYQHMGFECRYALSLFKNEVIKESLHMKQANGSKPALLFTRDNNKIELGSSLKKNINIDVSSAMPFLSYLFINYKIEKTNTALEWFLVSSSLSLIHQRPFSLLAVLPYFNENANIQLFDKKFLLKIISEIDIPIDNYEIEKNNDTNEIYTIWKKGEHTYKLNILNESVGTQKLFHLLSTALFALKIGGVLAIDEIDASLHPKLLRYIIKLFKNKKTNRYNAQLIFTSHDVTTMKGDIFRRDEIWFVSKNDEGASRIYSLYEIRDTDGSRVRADAPFDKQYMDGRYGADPYLTNIFSNEWEASYGA